MAETVLYLLYKSLTCLPLRRLSSESSSLSFAQHYPATVTISLWISVEKLSYHSLAPSLSLYLALSSFLMSLPSSRRLPLKTFTAPPRPFFSSTFSVPTPNLSYRPLTRRGRTSLLLAFICSTYYSPICTDKPSPTRTLPSQIVTSTCIRLYFTPPVTSFNSPPTHYRPLWSVQPLRTAPISTLTLFNYTSRPVNSRTNPILSTLSNHLLSYPTPSSLTYN